MSLTLEHQIRGWCPGALRPMQSGDGLIVRLRPYSGAFSAADLHLIAKISMAYGNGLIDLTRRANLQLRGIGEDVLPDLWHVLADVGLLDETAEAESVRNVMLNPLAGIDPCERADLRAVADGIEQRLAANPALWQLAGKFGFLIDGGGLLPLAAERADIRLTAIDGTRLAIGLDRQDDIDSSIDWLGAVAIEDGAALAVRAASLFLDHRPNARARMRDLTGAAYGSLRQALTTVLEPMASAPGEESRPPMLGPIYSDDRIVGFGLASAFGRIEAPALLTLTDPTAMLGISEFRLSPWRALYGAVENADTAEALRQRASETGFILDADDPLLAIDACPGAPGCASARCDTRAAARAIAPRLAQLGYRSCHISGCAKGCARSAKADLVLIGEDGGFDVVHDGTAGDRPERRLAARDVSRLPASRETV
ncbi:precorrin-3B synthase [Methyloligella sp. 2.7D]|uniref:precorrin-3B synthase n=1 Tax=unclassified Methyloligella TaxID=2625955 RepID=UPI00157CEECE|nr:precorrin-3B synthase [Methyloligella sp. GL2]QKP78177.1 precorrin-3B synthase [Methyloligella sp. GL2]